MSRQLKPFHTQKLAKTTVGGRSKKGWIKTAHFCAFQMEIISPSPLLLNENCQLDFASNATDSYGVLL